MSALDYEESEVSIKGGFAGCAPLNLRGYREPLLLSSAAGVSAKLLIAKELGKWDTIGIDLVAMSVNDLAACGARPLQFLHRIACGKIEVKKLQSISSGIVIGCEYAGCALAGGETLQAPDLYGPEDLDLAGFAVGIVEKHKVLPRSERMEEGDLILGMPSSGLHSHGFSAARRVLPASTGLWEELLTPTKIYVNELFELMGTGRILGAAHIAGSGLSGNIQRILPPGLVPRFSWDWKVPQVFTKIEKTGKISMEEMRSVFNMGMGIVLIAKYEEAEGLLEIAKARGIDLARIGQLIRG